MSSSNISFDRILKTSQYFAIPPWYIKPPDNVFELVHLKEDPTNALVYRQHFLEIKNEFSDFIQIYTDGSQDGGAETSATVFQSETISKRLDN